MNLVTVWSRVAFAATAVLIATACDPVTPTTTVTPEPLPEPATCAEAQDAIDVELAIIQACDTDNDCGQVLTGTSCGCTRNLVASLDADTTRFYTLLDIQGDLECGGMISTCDCPSADGYACNEGTCSWNFIR